MCLFVCFGIHTVKHSFKTPCSSYPEPMSDQVSPWSGGMNIGPVHAILGKKAAVGFLLEKCWNEASTCTANIGLSISLFCFILFYFFSVTN